MSKATFEDVFASHEAKYAEDVRRATWGHLAPTKNKTYRGRVVWALGCFESGELNPTPLSCEFAGLDDSPWFYDHLIEFLASEQREVGCVYEFKGTFRNYQFTGEIRCVFDSGSVP